MPTRWLDRTQPQTLYIATMLMYFNAALSLLFGATRYNTNVFGIHHGSLLIGLLLIAGEIGGAWGIANEKKWGYIVALVVAFLLLAETVLSFYSGALLTLIFEVALVALLLHP